MEFTQAFELKALPNIAPRFLTLLADDISIESILILLILIEFLRFLLISTKTSVLSLFSSNMLAVIQDLMSMTQFFMSLTMRGNDSALFGLKAMYSCVSSAQRWKFIWYFRAIAPSCVVYRVNSIGPSTDPWGSPKDRSRYEDRVPLITPIVSAGSSRIWTSLTQHLWFPTHADVATVYYGLYYQMLQINQAG